ncbi:MAG TPA: PPC domain-containing protein, partial [Pyrinomonadaceae bacterium]|nr:PPC domain-containing protein [Pyrinomonadaceae bacterium]
ANNNFVSAQVINGCAGTVNGTNVAANKEAGEPSHSPDADPGGHSVWYQWEAPSTGNVTITTAGSGFDTVLAVYTGTSVNALTSLGKNDDVSPPGDVTSSVTFSATTGTTYRIAVDGWDSATGNIALNWSASNCPPITIDSVAPLAGRASGGQEVKLSGSFANLSVVMYGGISATWTYTNGTSEVTVTTPAHSVGAVNIDLVPTSGSTVSKVNGFAYLPTVFTDDTLVVGVTPARAQHIIELRQAVDALRAVAGLAPAPWTDTLLVPTFSPIRTVHIQELRTYLDGAASSLGYSTQLYTDPGISSGFVIGRIHIEELRQRIRTIAG